MFIPRPAGSILVPGDELTTGHKCNMIVQLEISKRGKIIAWLTPPPAPKPSRPRKRPDFAARLKRIYGDKVLRGDVIVEERESRPY